jgi:hypothetical protein
VSCRDCNNPGIPVNSLQFLKLFDNFAREVHSCASAAPPVARGRRRVRTTTAAVHPGLGAASREGAEGDAVRPAGGVAGHPAASVAPGGAGSDAAHF